MADAAAVGAGDTVVEIGPGTGVLTKELLSRKAKVIAVEADNRAIHILKHTFQDSIENGQLELIHADARSLDLASLGVSEYHYRVVANIPYYLSGRLFRLFLESSIQPSTLVFLVQREVAERIARDTKESILSLSVKAYGTPVYVATVAPGNFTPQPRVDSAIIAVTNISHGRLQGIDERFFFELLHAGFASKRKQLMGNLSSMFQRELLMHTFSTLGLRNDVRGEDVGLDMWISLARELMNKKSTK